MDIHKLFHSLSPEKEKFVREETEWMEAYLTGKAGDGAFEAQTCDGYRLIPGFNAETIKKSYTKMKPDQDTVILGGFPKSGIHWMAEILRQILFGHNEELLGISKTISPIFTWIGLGHPKKVDVLEHIALPRKLFLTHLPTPLVNIQRIRKNKAKVVIVVRNPKDLTVSWFHFSKQLAFREVKEEQSEYWQRFVNEFVEGKHPRHTLPGEWYPDYLLGWYKHKDYVMFVHYEDMKQEPEKEIKRVAEFLNVDLLDERVRQITLNTSFTSMKQEKTDAQDNRMIRLMNVVRKGQVGGWKDTFTVSQSEMMDKIMEEKLANTNFKFTYE